MATIVVVFPQSWLSWTISVVNMATEVEDFSGVINEIWTTKTYKYEFVEVANTDYSFVVSVTGYDAISGAIFRDTAGWSGGWLTTEEHTKLFSLVNSYGGGFSINYEAINSHTTRKVNELKETIEKQPNYTEKLNEIDSHISLARNYIIDTIEEVETEVCSDIIRKTDELKKDNVTTRNLVRQKTNKLDENVSKLADRQELTDKMIESEADELEEEIDKLYKKEADDLEKEIESKFNEEFD